MLDAYLNVLNGLRCLNSDFQGVNDIEQSEPSQHTKPDFLQTPIGAGSQFDRTTLEQTLP
jgi:hypothetical protein